MRRGAAAIEALKSRTGLVLVVFLLASLGFGAPCPAQWVAMDTLGVNLYAVWGSGPDDVYAGGDGGWIFHYDGFEWAEEEHVVTSAINDIDGTGAGNIRAVGYGGVIAHYDGLDWMLEDSGTTEPLHGIWHRDATHAWAVGANGTVLHLESAHWETVDPDTNESLYAVTGLQAYNEVFAAGFHGLILHYGGTSWTPMITGTSTYFKGICKRPGAAVPYELYAVGSAVSLHYHNHVWEPMDGGTLQILRSVWALDSSHIYAVGHTGIILFSGGTSWTPMDSPTPRFLADIWGSAEDDLYAVGEIGLVLHYGGPQAVEKGSWGRVKGRYRSVP